MHLLQVSAMQEMAGIFEYRKKLDDPDEINGNELSSNDTGAETENVQAKRRTIHKPLSAFGQPKWTRKTDRNKQHTFDNAPVPGALNEKQSKLFTDLKQHSPLDLFELFFDDEMFMFILDETNRYSQQQNSSFVLEMSELRRFIGILIVSGYHTLPALGDYWSNKPSLGVSIIKQAMSRNRFQDIKRFIHFCNNDMLDKNDKLAKVI